MIKTLKFRVKDKHKKWLQQQAEDVNFVWNYINELSFKMISKKNKYLSSFDIQKYTNGASKHCSLLGHTIQEIGKEYVIRRNQCKLPKLKWRSTKNQKTLGWIPFKSGNLIKKNGKLFFNEKQIFIWDSYNINNFDFKGGSFNQDIKGNWFLNVHVEFSNEINVDLPHVAVGIDLGLKNNFTLSDGKVYQINIFQDLQEKIAIAQKSKQKKQRQNAFLKLKNKRKDTLHKITNTIINQYGYIYVGDIKSKQVINLGLGKSVNDSMWFLFKLYLQYKANQSGRIFEIVNESFTTVTCSTCLSLSGPTGKSNLRIREWKCSHCNTMHNRDINAAKNILAVGYNRLDGGIFK